MSCWLFLPPWDLRTDDTRFQGVSELVSPGTAVCQAVPTRAVDNPPCAHLTPWQLPREPSSKRNVGLALQGVGAKPETRPPTPALLATTALEGVRPAQDALRPALSIPTWLQKEARVWQSASPALLATSAHPQVLWLRSPVGLAPTARARQGPPHLAQRAMPALLAPPPTLAQGSWSQRRLAAASVKQAPTAARLWTPQPASPVPLDSAAIREQRATTASPAQWGTTVQPGPPAPGPARQEPLGTAAGQGQLESACHAPKAPSVRGLARLAASPAGALLSLHLVPVMGYSVSLSPGASHCTCRGLNRVFQKSDGSCICQAGHESYSRRGLESEESNSDEDCQPQVADRCSAGEVRLAATRKCVSPQLHNCSSVCHPVDGKLNGELGICQCQEYVSAEELCDAQCLAKAPQLSLAWGSNRELILSVKGKAGDSDQREVSSTLGPDQFFQENARVHLVQCGPHGIFGFVISRVDMLGAFLFEPPVSSRWLQRHHRTTGLEHPVPQDPGIRLRIPNPVICLTEGDVILFQLHILPHSRSASHYPVYQRQHLFNSNPTWDFGTFRRLGHLVRETHLNFSRFAHQFLDPGTYVFRDNGLPESTIVVLVKKRGVACDPGLSPVQPSSPYQLARHGVLRHSLPNLGPDWTVITGVLLAVGSATVLLTGLGLVLRPSLAQACPVRAWKPQWRGLGEPHVPAEYVPLRDSLLFYEDLGPQFSREGADSEEKAVTWDTGEPLSLETLEDFSVRTLYDKLEDQSLHVAAQLSKHRSEALAFYRGASQQLQGLQDFLQHLGTTERQALGKDGDPEVEAKAAARTDTEQSEELWGLHAATSPRGPWQLPLGCTPSVTPLGFQPELDRAIVALASALSHAHAQPSGASRKVSVQVGEEPLPTCQQNLQLASNMPLKPQPPPLDEEHQSTSLQQDLGPGQLPQHAAEEGGTEGPGSRLWILGAGHRHEAFPEMQRKIWQVEDTLDELNEEFFQLTAHALELQKEKDKPGQPPPSEGRTFVEVPNIFPGVRQEDRPYPAEAGGPDGENLGTWALKREEALMLEVRRAHLAQRIEDLEWELSLLLQVADGSRCTEGSRPGLGTR
ncbi:uncharacterized protein LOC120248569 [Hyaena hyaena]|uniref:uncharacterized protein LOC120248569 n=1 Tax=Hyaena hyaena TaxID=95912 RepID=UPI001923367E|nr:uncharacterized protein LOC120248569 [Hyaena hyaena]